MIDFRYHVVSLVSVFLALAVGVVLGAGPLKGTIGDTLTSQVDQLRAEKADLRTQLDTAQSAVANRDTFIRTVQPTLVAQQLVGQSVVLVSLPGSDSDGLPSLTQALQAAGARVTGRVVISDAWTDPAKSADRERARRTLATLTPSANPSGGQAFSASGAAATGTAPGAVRPPLAVTPAPAPTVTGVGPASLALSSALADALLTPVPGAPTTLDATSQRVLDELRSAGLISLDGDLQGQATQAVVLAPAVAAPGKAPSPSVTPAVDPLPQWTALAVALDRHGDGTVVAGPASSASPGGLLAAIRGQKPISQMLSTIDTGGTPMGDVTTALALHEQSLGGAGSYGFVAPVNGPLPTPTGTTKP